MKAKQKDLCIRILKIIGLLAVIAVWLYLAVQIWNTGKIPGSIGKTTYLDRLEKLDDQSSVEQKSAEYSIAKGKVRKK